MLILFGFLILKAEAQSSAADSLYLLGNYSAAINAYSELGDENANLQIARAYNAIGNKEKGKLFDKSKKYEEAILLFKQLTTPESANPEFYYYLGKSYQSNLDYEKGNSALKKAIKLDSTHLRSIYLLGKYYVGVEEPANAMKIIDLGLKTAPDDVALINLKALSNFDTGYYEKSAPLFERLIELGEKKPFVYKKLGYSQANIKEFEKAKKTYRRLEKIQNQEADAYKGLAQVYLLEKKLDSAETYFLKSIEERRYIFDNEYQSLGRITRLKGELKKSLDYYTKAWEEDRLNQLNYWQVCVLADEYYKDPKIKLRNYEKLLSDFERLYPFLKERAQKRIKELKEEIHFNAE